MPPVTRRKESTKRGDKSDKSANETSSTTHTKRNRSPQQLDHNLPKRSKTIKLTSKQMDEFKQLLGEVTKEIGERIDSSNTSLSTKFDNLATHVCNEVTSLKSSVDNFKAEVACELGTVNTTLANQNIRIENTEDDIDRLKRINDLRLTGILPTENENLFQIVERFAIAIGYSSFGQIAVSFERIPVRDRITGQLTHSNTIMLHFAILRDKQIFYSHYLYKAPINAETLNIPNNGKVILCENLTIKNRKIFGAAQRLRREKKIAQVFTEDGIVRIRFIKGKNEASFVVRNNLMLETLVTQQSLLLSSQNRSMQSNDDAHTNETLLSTAQHTTQAGAAQSKASNNNNHGNASAEHMATD